MSIIPICIYGPHADSPIIPLSDRVLIRRIEEPDDFIPITDGVSVVYHSIEKPKIKLTDAPKSLKGEVLAVGPGKRDEDGEIQPLQVKPGDMVLFSSKWNDLASDHYYDLPVGTDPMIHLVQEADIIGIL